MTNTFLLHFDWNYHNISNLIRQPCQENLTEDKTYDAEQIMEKFY